MWGHHHKFIGWGTGKKAMEIRKRTNLSGKKREGSKGLSLCSLRGKGH